MELKGFVADVADEVFSFDNRVFITLKSIVTKPGEITVAYLEGKRIRFIPPVRLYLVLSFLLVFSKPDYGRLGESPFSDFVSTSESNEVKVRQIHFLFRTLEIDSVTFANLKDVSNQGLDSIFRKQAIYSDPIFKGFIRKVQTLDNKKGWEEIRSFQESITSTRLILCMPVLALFLMLFFRRRYRFYFQHLIHSVHLNSVGFILIIIGDKFRDNLIHFLIPKGDFSSTNFWFVFPFIVLFFLSSFLPLLAYSYISLRKIYEESRLATFCKLLIMACLYSVCFNILFELLKVGFVFYEA